MDETKTEVVKMPRRINMQTGIIAVLITAGAAYLGGVNTTTSGAVTMTPAVAAETQKTGE